MIEEAPDYFIEEAYKNLIKMNKKYNEEDTKTTEDTKTVEESKIQKITKLMNIPK